MNDIKRNAEHYYDPTAFEAILSIEQERKGKERKGKTYEHECKTDPFLSGRYRYQ